MSTQNHQYTALESRIRIAVGHRVSDTNHRSLGRTREYERLDCIQHTLEGMPDQDRVNLDWAATTLMDAIPGLGVLGAMELLACLGMWMSRRDVKVNFDELRELDLETVQKLMEER